MMLLLWLALLVTAPLVHADAPTITGVTGASSFVSTGQFTIFGGLAGIACNGDGTNPCSSCTPDGIATSTTGSICSTSPLCQCNEARIYDNLILRINLQPAASTTTSTGTSTTPATPSTSSEAYAQAIVSGGSGSKTTLAKNTATNGGTFIDFKWSTICSFMGSSSCESLYSSSTSTQILQLEIDVWIDTDSSGSGGPTGNEQSIPIYVRLVLPPSESVYGNTISDGIGAFTPFPGDTKVYMTNVQAANSFPNLSYGIPATAMKVFISPNSLDDANYQNPPVSPQQLSLNSTDGSLSSQVVSGLTNDQLYFFRIAIVDQANNVVQYFPDSTGLDAACTAASPSAACPYSATPTQVLGLLTKDMNCFVATAAYGSSLEPKLETFRSFRRRFLLPFKWGRKFVDNYYNYGTRAARFIGDKPKLRAVVRLGLWPLYGFSALALRWGLASSLALAIAICGILIMFMCFGLRLVFGKTPTPRGGPGNSARV